MNSDSKEYQYANPLDETAIRYIQDQEFVEPGSRIVLDFEEGVQTFKAGYQQAIKDIIKHIEDEWFFNGIPDNDDVAKFVRDNFKDTK